MARKKIIDHASSVTAGSKPDGRPKKTTAPHSHYSQGGTTVRNNHPGSGAVKESRKSPCQEDDDSDNFASFKKQLESLGLMLRDVTGDGNCLFRALSDQLDGDDRNHFSIRKRTVGYMKEHRADFEPFVSDQEISFDRHLDNLCKLGTYGGQDCLVAFARLNDINIVIHQLNSPVWRIEGGPPTAAELHLFYHDGEHYSSVRRKGDHSHAPAQVRLSPTALATINSVERPKSTEDVSTVPSASTTASTTTHTNNSTSSSISTSNSNSHKAKRKQQQRKAKSNSPNLVTSLGDVPDELTQYVMDASGCEDPVLVDRTLRDHQFNVELAVDFLLNLNLSLLSISTQSDDFISPRFPISSAVEERRSRSDPDVSVNGGNGRNSAKKKSKPPFEHTIATTHISNRERKEQKRLDKLDRSGVLLSNRPSCPVPSDNDDETYVISNVQCLHL